jgi:hypothetical protein
MGSLIKNKEICRQNTAAHGQQDGVVPFQAGQT